MWVRTDRRLYLLEELAAFGLELDIAASVARSEEEPWRRTSA